MTVENWLTLAGLAVAIIIPFAGWMTAMYRKISQITVHLEYVHEFTSEVKPKIHEIENSLTRHSERIDDHKRRLEALEH